VQQAHKTAPTHPETGLACPACLQTVATLENFAPPVLILRCPACSNRWTAYAPETQKH